jgi:HKD family nuclease
MITFLCAKKTKGSIYCNEYEGKRDIVAHRQIYSLKKFAAINILNDELQKIMAILKIKRNYISRCKTYFATSFLRAGGPG